ncbi:MAG: CRISPR-associated protein [Scytonema sp. PMC 1069.18]|nr:CRISPR-associated protein [Scytonema sp. PMC 1069.18]MEC4884108.1 CRISPR-associated protein [Scytonema sp. PMC 1070.18]
MQQVVISSIGTSLLTNQINRGSENEKDWYPRLRDTANLTWEKTPEDVKEIILTLKERATQKLEVAKIPQIRSASAELNGIYGLYQDNLEQGKPDIHWLIATDTAQGETTAQIVQNYLRSQNLMNANIYTPPGLSTASTEAFLEGISQLIKWMQDSIEPYKSQYKICFNLVGSFKSLQGYLNTIGMFYADEIIYIFEGENSKMLTIPRLPVTVDTSYIEPHKVYLAMMEEGEIPTSLLKDNKIPKDLVWEIGSETILSPWGQLIWNQCKNELLTQDLLKFPRITYTSSFLKDYEKIQNHQEKIKLQETIAKVAQLLSKSNGNPISLREDGGLQYSKYTNTDGIDHFRVTLGLRVSCKVLGNTVELRYYGTHDHVEGKELP